MKSKNGTTLRRDLGSLRKEVKKGINTYKLVESAFFVQQRLERPDIVGQVLRRANTIIDEGGNELAEGAMTGGHKINVAVEGVVIGCTRKVPVL